MLRQAGETPFGVDSVAFVLPGLPGSVNEIYQWRYSIHKGRQVWGLKDEWMIWKSRMKVHIPPWTVPADTVVCCTATFYYQFYHRNGNLRKVDTHNMMKLMIDMIADRIGVDDKWFKRGSWDSEDLPDADPYVEVVLSCPSK